MDPADADELEILLWDAGSGSSLLGFWLESILYGVMIMLCWSTLAVLVNSRASAPTNKFLLSATALMFTLATVHLVLNGLVFLPILSWISQPFQAPTSMPAIINVEEVGDRLVQGVLAVTWTQIVVGDTVNIYRLWFVWNRSIRVTIVPGILYLASVACACVAIALEYALIGGDSGANVANFGGFEKAELGRRTAFLAFQVVALLQAVVTCGLIVLRIWRTDAAAVTYREGYHSSLAPIARIITQSACFYVAALLALVIFYGIEAYDADDQGASSQAYGTLLNMMTPIVAITFCSLTTRVGVHSAKVRLAAAAEVRPSHVSQLPGGLVTRGRTATSTIIDSFADYDVGRGEETDRGNGPSTGDLEEGSSEEPDSK